MNKINLSPNGMLLNKEVIANLLEQEKAINDAKNKYLVEDVAHFYYSKGIDIDIVNNEVALDIDFSPK